MATNTPISTSSTVSYDEILSTTSPPPSSESLDVDYDQTNLLLFIFPFYILAIIMNFLSIYTILLARVYRQYLSNVLLAVICIGSLVNAHGQVFLALLRWSNNSSSDSLCSSSFYLRDCGSILIHTHILILVFERILAFIKKQPAYANNNLILRAHFLLIIISFISIILALTVPIYTYQRVTYYTFDGLCIPENPRPFIYYLDWIYYGFGHPLLWLSLILLLIFYFQQKANIYASLMPMNRLVLIIIILSCLNLIIQTLLDDIIGIGNDGIIDQVLPSTKQVYFMNIRDVISFLHKCFLGLVFFVFRPEIRSWLCDSFRRFRNNQKDALTPQRLELENGFDELNIHDQINDDTIQIRTDS